MVSKKSKVTLMEKIDFIEFEFIKKYLQMNENLAESKISARFLYKQLKNNVNINMNIDVFNSNIKDFLPENFTYIRGWIILTRNVGDFYKIQKPDIVNKDLKLKNRIFNFQNRL